MDERIDNAVFFVQEDDITIAAHHLDDETLVRCIVKFVGDSDGEGDDSLIFRAFDA